MRHKIRLIYANLALLCVLLACFEVFGQVAYFVLKGHPVFKRDQYLVAESAQPFELHPFLVARLRANTRVQQGATVLTTTPDHTRWTGAKPDRGQAIRVALLGGSTTFGSGVTDADSWPARLQAQLGPDYAVTNYGVPGYSSAEAVIQMALVVPESTPDIVVVYEGWNDIHNYHDPDLGSDYYGHGIRQYSNLDIQRPLPTGLLGKFADLSAVVQFAKVIAERIPAHAAGAAHQASSKPAYPAPDALGDPTPDPLVDRVYVRNLGTLKTLGQQMHAFVFYVPQVLDYSRFSGPGGSWWTPHVQNAAMPFLLDRFNAFMNTVCAPGEAGCAVLNDVQQRKWQDDDFIDEGHFSALGQRRLCAADRNARHRAGRAAAAEGSCRRVAGTPAVSLPVFVPYR